MTAELILVSTCTQPSTARESSSDGYVRYVQDGGIFNTKVYDYAKQFQLPDKNHPLSPAEKDALTQVQLMAEVTGIPISSTTMWLYAALRCGQVADHLGNEPGAVSDQWLFAEVLRFTNPKMRQRFCEKYPHIFPQQQG